MSMSPSPEVLKLIKESEEAIRKNILENYKEGTVLFVKTDFNTSNLYFSVESVEIINDLTKVENIYVNPEEYLVINCFTDIACDDFTNEFIFDKKEVKSGDKVYVVTADDGDAYGQFVLRVFTEEPNKDELIKKYNDSIKLEDDCDYCFTYYISDIFEIVID